MTNKPEINTASLAAALTSALVILATVDSAQSMGENLPGKDKCYGVALKGQNDCAAGAGMTCSGTQTVNYDGARWKYVPKGTCTTMKTPHGRGSLSPKG
ncbi:MAG TPA: DUF2282 domain-containing protein [Methylocella sp.]|nr:DUF2282 domain-containing protein [Methylocella sp.]